MEERANYMYIFHSDCLEKDCAGGTAAMQIVEEGRNGQSKAAGECAKMRAVGAAKELERLQRS